MVEKKSSRIAQNPKKKTVSPDADQWIIQGGIDPEVSPPTTDANSEETLGKKYPHRVSFDMGNEQYKRLKWAAFDKGCSMNEILREAIDEWMKLRNY
jgi:hypothetical protein